MIEYLAEPIADETRLLIKNTVSQIFATVPSKISQVYNIYFRNFSYILEVNYLTCTKVRTIINKDASVDLRKIYVKAKYKSQEKIYGDDDIAHMIRNENKVVVTGFGGIGKTVFLKYLWITLFDNPHGKLPIFFELRNTNDVANADLITHIRLSLAFEDKSIDPEVFTALLAEGRFVFLLDGFDEIADQNRTDIERQIQLLAKKYPRCAIIVSSRQDSRFYAWQDFVHFNVMKFDKGQSAEVIEKAEFDKRTKAEFRKEILEKRYEKYQDFFGTPLLTLMMLMTYQQIRYIPDNPHEFYKYAFQTLYTLHDASKQGFQRKRFVDLSEAQFVAVFSLFCLVTYSKSQQSFEKRTLIEYFDHVKKRSNCDYDSEMVFREAVESVNLLYADGDQFVFVHRSFQEYFTAYAATHYYSDSFLTLIDHLPLRFSDSVYSMIYAINRDMFEKMYLIKKFEYLKDFIAQSISIQDSLDLLRYVDAKMMIAKTVNSERGTGSAYIVDVSFNSEFLQLKYRLDLALRNISNAEKEYIELDEYIEDKKKIKLLELDDMGLSILNGKNKTHKAVNVFYKNNSATFQITEVVIKNEKMQINNREEAVSEELVQKILKNDALSLLICQKVKSSIIEIRERLAEIKRASEENKISEIDILAI